jgi:hypothetical protein
MNEPKLQTCWHCMTSVLATMANCPSCGVDLSKPNQLGKQEFKPAVRTILWTVGIFCCAFLAYGISAGKKPNPRSYSPGIVNPTPEEIRLWAKERSKLAEERVSPIIPANTEKPDAPKNLAVQPNSPTANSSGKDRMIPSGLSLPRDLTRETETIRNWSILEPKLREAGLERVHSTLARIGKSLKNEEHKNVRDIRDLQTIADLLMQNEELSRELNQLDVKKLEFDFTQAVKNNGPFVDSWARICVVDHTELDDRNSNWIVSVTDIYPSSSQNTRRVKLSGETARPERGQRVLVVGVVDYDYQLIPTFAAAPELPDRE